MKELFLVALLIGLAIIPAVYGHGSGHYCTFYVNGTIKKCFGAKQCYDACGYDNQVYNGTRSYAYLQTHVINATKDSFSISTNSLVYNPGAEVIFTGMVYSSENTPSKQPVIVEVINIHQQVILYKLVTPTSDGNFAFVEQTVGVTHVNDGRYLVLLKYGQEIAYSYFFIESKT